MQIARIVWPTDCPKDHYAGCLGPYSAPRFATSGMELVSVLRGITDAYKGDCRR